jgi:hypothetical protein
MEKINTGIWEKLPSELYVIGDIHGDFYALKQALIMTGCVLFSDIKTTDIVKQYGEEILLIDGCDYYKNEDIVWNKNKKDCIIVFAGDLIDRCRNIINNVCSLVVHDEDCDYKILKLLLDLNNKAKLYDSKIIIVLGNHEIMNLEEKLNYVSRKALINLDSRKSNIALLIKENKDNLYGVVRIGKYIICHGGINPNFLEENKQYFDNNKEFIEHYNNHVRNFLLNPNYKFNYLITNKDSPFWDRTNGINNLALSDLECKKIFQDNILNIKGDISNLKIIVAHCPQIINSPKMGINVTNCGRFEDKIWRVDIAMSRAFDNYVSDDIMNILLNELNEKINNNSEIDLEFILKFNVPRESTFDNVQLLNINSKSESIIMGEASLRYFYKDVFKNHTILMILYLLQDIESNYSYIYGNVFNPTLITKQNIEIINDLKKKIQNKIFSKTHTNYFINYKK